MNCMRCILLADDDADDRDALKEALCQAGSTYEIMEAFDGREAFRKLNELKIKGALPSLIVLDVNMPRMNGRQTLLSLQEDKVLSGIPVVMYTTAACSPSDASSYSGKNVAYITKPSRYDALLDVATRLLNFCNH